MRIQATAHLRLPGNHRRGQAGSPPGSLALLTLWFRLLACKAETVHCCGFEPLSLWYFVTATWGKQHSGLDFEFVQLMGEGKTVTWMSWPTGFQWFSSLFYDNVKYLQEHAQSTQECQNSKTTEILICLDTDIKTLKSSVTILVLEK